VEAPRPVIGYITLLACHVTNQHVKPFVEEGTDLAGYSFNYPAIKIARLAVDEDHRGNDLGKKLVGLACAISVEIMG
jgi:predicted N-acetyltransferase YhbS